MKFGQLGKLPPRHDVRTLQLANYLDLPKIPAKASWTSKVKQWGMMRNDVIGDCTIAGAAHQIQTWTANNGNEITIPDTEILKAYEKIGGYNPNDPNSDRGCVELDVLKYWRKTGIGGDKIFAFTTTEPKNKAHVCASIFLFGGAYLGLALPLSAQNQKVWSVPPGGATGNGAPGSWGGHCVIVVSYDAHTLTCVTWGALKKMTWEFFITYTDESYAILSKDWAALAKKAPSGFDFASLQTDLKQVS